jgi:hypothetical protein
MRGLSPLSPESTARLTASVEEINSRKGIKAKLCLDCVLAGKRKSAYPLDPKFKSNYEDHIKSHKEIK